MSRLERTLPGIGAVPTGMGQKADKRCNFRNGPCHHQCKYCGAATWPYARPDWRLNPHFAHSTLLKRPDEDKDFRPFPPDTIVQVPTGHDIRTVTDAVLAFAWTSCKLVCGANVLIHTKPCLRAMGVLAPLLAALPDPLIERILVRATIGSRDNGTLRFWEPGAPSYSERRRSLVLARNHGLRTSVGLTPMLDGTARSVAKDLCSFVTDGFWVGIMVKGNGRTPTLHGLESYLELVSEVRYGRRDMAPLDEVRWLYREVYNSRRLQALVRDLKQYGKVVVENEMLDHMGQPKRPDVERAWLLPRRGGNPAAGWRPPTRRDLEDRLDLPAWAWMEVENAYGRIARGLEDILGDKRIRTSERRSEALRGRHLVLA
jgi:hypothetical protein